MGAGLGDSGPRPGRRQGWPGPPTPGTGPGSGLRTSGNLGKHPGSLPETSERPPGGLREASGRPPGDLWAGPGFVTFGSGKDNNCWGAFRVSLGGGFRGKGLRGPREAPWRPPGAFRAGPGDVILGTGKITTLGGAFGTFPLFPPLPASLRGRGPGSGPPGPGPGGARTSLPPGAPRGAAN